MAVHIVTGSESVLRYREIRRLVGERFRVVHSPEALADALDPVMFEDSPPVWCRDFAWTEGMANAAMAFDGILVVDVDGDLPAKSPWSKKKESVSWVETPSPKPWERKQLAQEFVRDEAMKRYLILKEAFGNSLVAISGTDLGVLSFELDKLSTYLQELGEQEVQPKHLAQIRGGFVETGTEELVWGVGQRKPDHVTQSLTLIERTMGTGSSVVMRVIGILAYNLRIWLSCKSLCGGEPNALGARLGLHPFVLKKQHFPHASQWSEKGLLELLHALAKVQLGIRRGHISPFLRLHSTLLRSLQTSS